MLTERLREARERHEMPSRARVVAWGEESSIEPLVAAGFDVVSVLSPAQALARVVRARQASAVAGTAIAAVSLNTHGAAIVIVAGTEVIHSRSFEWPLGTPFTGARTELLDRYLLVSQLAPQLQHVIALVRPVYGVAVTSIVTCGNLPGLRSLSMLLIEEMDLEVETLDSADLLDAGMSTSFGESAATLQLAAAVASSGEQTRACSRRAGNGIREQRGVTTAPPGCASASSPACSMPAAVAALVLCAAWSALQITGTSPAVAVFLDGRRAAPSKSWSWRFRRAGAAGRGDAGAVDDRGRQRCAFRPHDASPARPRRGPRRSLPTPLPSVDGILITGERAAGHRRRRRGCRRRCDWRPRRGAHRARRRRPARAVRPRDLRGDQAAKASRPPVREKL